MAVVVVVMTVVKIVGDGDDDGHKWIQDVGVESDGGGGAVEENELRRAGGMEEEEEERRKGQIDVEE